MTAVVGWRAPVDFLALLSEERRRRLVTDAEALTLPDRSVAEYPRGRLDADIIESGLIRAFQVSDDGREATIGYLYGGEYLGALPALGPAPIVYVQPLVETRLLRLSTSRVSELLDGDGGMSRALAVHTATILARVVHVVTVRTLGSVLERVAFDLLERMSAEQLRSGELVCRVTHQELAGSVGSVREVVTRAVAELRGSGIISTSSGKVRVEDVSRLTRVVQGLVL